MKVEKRRPNKMILNLQAVKKYIAETTAKCPASAEGKSVAGTLAIIQSLIESYEKSYNPAYLYDTLRLIECIQLADLKSSLGGLFSNPEMRQFLIENKFSVFTRSHQSKDIRNHHGIQYALPKSAEPILGAIYKKISSDLGKNHITWFHSLPVNEHNEVMNDEIRNWQQYMAGSPESPTLAHRDFTRDIRIGNNSPASLRADTHAKTDDNIRNAITQLVEKSSYGDKKSIISAWLSARGGQEMNSFISLMIKNQLAFRIPKSTLNTSDPDIIPSMRAEAKTSNWSLDENGQATFSLDYQVKTIQFGSESALLKCRDGIVREVSTDTNEFEASLKSVAYIASVACKVKLDVDSTGNVTPKVTSLVVVSYTDMLKPSPSLTPNSQLPIEHRKSAPF